MTQYNDISMIDAKRIARANGYKAGMPVSELQAIQIVSAGYFSGYSAGLKAAAEKEEKKVLSE